MGHSESIAELTRRESTLASEIADWIQRSAANIENSGLHKTQLGHIARAHEVLGKKRSTLLAQLQETTNETDFSNAYLTLVEELVGASELWRIYRTGLEQHNFSPFKRFVHAGMLAAKDILDTALADAGVAQGVPPIMLLLEAAFSPAAAGRASMAADTGFVVRRYRALRLPVPIVLVPADQATSMWSLVHLCHEVGHTLSQELGDLAGVLRGKLANLPASVPPDRTKYWATWASEMLADLFGVAIGGPAFGSALSAVLLPLASATRFQLLDQGAAGPSSSHPPPQIRRRLVIALLRASAFDDNMADAIESDWATVVEPSFVSAFTQDLPAVVETVRALELANTKLVRSLASYAPDQRFTPLVKFLGAESGAKRPAPLLPDPFQRRYIPLAAELARRDHPDQLESIHTRALEFANALPFVQFAGGAFDVVSERASALSFSQGNA